MESTRVWHFKLCTGSIQTWHSERIKAKQRYQTHSQPYNMANLQKQQHKKWCWHQIIYRWYTVKEEISLLKCREQIPNIKILSLWKMREKLLTGSLQTTSWPIATTSNRIKHSMERWVLQEMFEVLHIGTLRTRWGAWALCRWGSLGAEEARIHIQWSKSNLHKEERNSPSQKCRLRWCLIWTISIQRPASSWMLVMELEHSWGWTPLRSWHDSCPARQCKERICRAQATVQRRVWQTLISKSWLEKPSGNRKRSNNKRCLISNRSTSYNMSCRIRKPSSIKQLLLLQRMNTTQSSWSRILKHKARRITELSESKATTMSIWGTFRMISSFIFRNKTLNWEARNCILLNTTWFSKRYSGIFGSKSKLLTSKRLKLKRKDIVFQSMFTLLTWLMGFKGTCSHPCLRGSNCQVLRAYSRPGGPWDSTRSNNCWMKITCLNPRKLQPSIGFSLKLIERIHRVLQRMSKLCVKPWRAKKVQWLLLHGQEMEKRRRWWSCAKPQLLLLENIRRQLTIVRASRISLIGRWILEGLAAPKEANFKLQPVDQQETQQRTLVSQKSRPEPAAKRRRMPMRSNKNTVLNPSPGHRKPIDCQVWTRVQWLLSKAQRREWPASRWQAASYRTAATELEEFMGCLIIEKSKVRECSIWTWWMQMMLRTWPRVLDSNWTSKFSSPKLKEG